MVRILWASCFLNLAGMVSNAVISATSLAFKGFAVFKDAPGFRRSGRA